MSLALAIVNAMAPSSFADLRRYSVAASSHSFQQVTPTHHNYNLINLPFVKKQKQLGFEILENKNVKYFGGVYLKNSNPKVKRPLALKRSMHLVLRSSMATGSHSFLRKERVLYSLLYKQAKNFGVKIYRFANGGNHLHLIIRVPSRESFNGFIRSISGLVAREILSAQRGSPAICKKKLMQRFWDKRPFTRIVEWGQEFKSVCSYLDQNALEAWGFLPFKTRKKYHFSTA